MQMAMVFFSESDAILMFLGAHGGGRVKRTAIWTNTIYIVKGLPINDRHLKTQKSCMPVEIILKLDEYLSGYIFVNSFMLKIKINR